jgi:uracil-DNA glycosylase family 4
MKDMIRQENRNDAPDPRKKNGQFAVLMNDILKCKTGKRCPSLGIRQFYFEPNPSTISDWKKRNLFVGAIDHRVVFVCESPGPSADKAPIGSVETCFYHSPRDDRFEKARRKYGLENCYITNTVKCGVRRGAKHTQSEVESCRGFLVREIDLIRPEIIVGVGGNAYRTIRTDTMSHLGTPPIVFQITHYSSRRNPWESWDTEFPELLRLLSKLRPAEEW